MPRTGGVDEGERRTPFAPVMTRLRENSTLCIALAQIFGIVQAVGINLMEYSSVRFVFLWLSPTSEVKREQQVNVRKFTQTSSVANGAKRLETFAFARRNG